MAPPRSTDNPRSTSRHRAAAICTPGLEAVCVDELKALGCRPKPGGAGVVEFDANNRQLYAANVWLRTASRVIVRLSTFRATDFFHLQEHAAAIDWDRWIPKGHAPRFRISTTDSKLYHTKAIAQRLHQVSVPPSIGEPEQLFVVRIARNNVTISVDSSGEALHRRPWRTEIGSAPLRTTMASAALLGLGWDPATGLVDPFGGSGTIGIEAALLARGLPPGGERAFAFHEWSGFEPGSWASVVASIESSAEGAAERAAAHRVGHPVLIADRNESAVESARANAERAGVADDIEFAVQVVSHLKARPGPGLVLTNPPYGRRIGRKELAGLYGRLGAVVRERLPGHGLALITAEPSLARAADDRLESKFRFRHGGLAVQLHHRPPPPATEPESEPEQAAPADAGDLM